MLRTPTNLVRTANLEYFLSEFYTHWNIEYLTDVPYYTMLELGLSIIAACLPTLGPLFSDERKANLSRNFRRVFSPSSHRELRPSKTYKSISETNFVIKRSNKRSLGVESFAMGGLEPEPSTMDGSIHITSNTSQHSTIEA